MRAGCHWRLVRQWLIKLTGRPAARGTLSVICQMLSWGEIHCRMLLWPAAGVRKDSRADHLPMTQRTEGLSGNLFPDDYQTLTL
jgi:hypothetical protein